MNNVESHTRYDVKRRREEFIEDLLASTSSEYLASIRESRADHRRGRTVDAREVIGG